MVEIRNQNELAGFLNGKDAQWAPIIAVRAALRIFPLSRDRQPPDDALLQVARALFVSQTALQFGGRDAIDAALVAASAAFTAGAPIYAIRVAEATYAVGKHLGIGGTLVAVEAVVDTVYSAGNLRNTAYNEAYRISLSRAPDELPESEAESDAAAFASEAVFLDSKGARRAIWKSIENDVSFLERGSGDFYVANNLLVAPLWIEEPYGNILICWNDLRNRLLASPAKHWEPWVEWYDACLKGGGIAFSAIPQKEDATFRMSLAAEGDDFWRRDVGTVNKEILDRLNTLRSAEIPVEDLEDDQDSEGAALQAEISIPNGQPALIEAAVVQGRVRLIEEPVAVSIGAEDFGDLMDALRHEGDRLVARVRSLANTDVRILSTLSDTVDYLKAPLTSKTNLFIVGHRYEVLADYSDIVKDEWPDVYAVDFNAFLKLYERTVKQAPKWQAMLWNAHQQHLSPQQTSAALEIAETFSTAVAEEPLIDDAIKEVLTESLDLLPEKAPDIVTLSEQVIGEGYELLAEDLLESINNVLKVMAKEVTQPLAELGSKMTVEFKERAGKSLVEAAGRIGDGVGDNLTKIPKALAKILGRTSAGYSGGMLLGEFLLHTFPTQFGWLAPVLKFLAPFLG